MFLQYNCIMKAQHASGFGSVILALLAHIPCCGPTLLLAFGGLTVGAGWLHALEPYRWWFMGFSVLSLGFGFWSAYRRPHACHECGTCGSGDHAQRRVRIGSMWFVAALVLSLTVVGLLNSGHAH